MTGTGDSKTPLQRPAVQLVCIQFITSVGIMIAAGTYIVKSGNTAQGIDLRLAQLLGAVAIGLLFFAGKIESFLITAATAKAQGTRGEESAVIVSFAVREAAAIIGLVITILSGDPIWVQVLGALTIVVMFFALKKKPV